MKKLLIHRRALPCAVAALVSVSLPGGAPPALAAPTRADEVRAVLAREPTLAKELEYDL